MNDVVIITGASHGLGRALALEFASLPNRAYANYELLLSGRDAAALSDVRRQINHGKTSVIVGDITWQTTLDQIEAETRKRNLAILVNNAGVYLNKPVREMSQGELMRVMETNFYAQTALTMRLLPKMREQRRGLIVNINSLAGERGSAGEAAYAASKHALRGFFDSLRLEETKYGIRILDVYLGAMRTGMTAERPNPDLLITPEDAAKVIVQNCKLYDSLAVNEIHIGRRNYG